MSIHSKLVGPLLLAYGVGIVVCLRPPESCQREYIPPTPAEQAAYDARFPAREVENTASETVIDSAFNGSLIQAHCREYALQGLQDELTCLTESAARDVIRTAQLTCSEIYGAAHPGTIVLGPGLFIILPPDRPSAYMTAD